MYIHIYIYIYIYMYIHKYKERVVEIVIPKEDWGNEYKKRTCFLFLNCFKGLIWIFMYFLIFSASDKGSSYSVI